MARRTTAKSYAEAVGSGTSGTGYAAAVGAAVKAAAQKAAQSAAAQRSGGTTTANKTITINKTGTTPKTGTTTGTNNMSAVLSAAKNQGAEAAKAAMAQSLAAKATGGNTGTSAAQSAAAGGYTPGYKGTYYEDIFADPTNDYNARAWVPGSGWSAIMVQDGKTVTTGLPVGSIIETAGGAYEVTGINPDGSYQSKLYGGVVPETKKDYSIYADMYDRGYNTGSIQQMIADQANGTGGYAGAIKNQQTTTYIDQNGDRQTGYVQGESYLDAMLGSLQEQYQAQLAANDSASAAATQKAILALENQKLQMSDEYDDLFEQLYLNRRMNEKSLPQQLAAMGYTGGLTESSMLGLQNSYQQALQEGELARLRGIRELDTAITDTQLTGDLERAQTAQELAGQYYANYASALQALQDQSNWERQFSYQQALAAQQQSELQRETAAENGWVLLENGILPGDAALAAMGLTAAEANSLLASLGGGSAGSGSGYYYTAPVVEPVVTPVASSGGGSYGESYSSIWQRARTMFDQGKSQSEIISYLDRFNERQLTDAGLDYIMNSLNLDGYRSIGG